MRAIRFLPALALSALLAATAGCAAAPPPGSDKVAAYYDSHKNLKTETRSTPEVPTVVAFMGDSYTAGAGSTEGSWAYRFAKKAGWKEFNLALGGTGYVSTSGKAGCDLDFCPNYLGVVGAVVEAAPDIVVVSGGRSDHLQRMRDVQGNADALFQQLRAQLPDAKLIAVSPVWDDTAPPESLEGIAEVVRAAVASVGGDYLEIGEPLAGHPELLASDGVHPNDLGHAALAAAAESAAKAAGLIP